MLEGCKKNVVFLFDYILHILVSGMEYGRQLQIAELSSTDQQRRPHWDLQVLSDFFIGFIQERTFLHRDQSLWIQITNMNYETGWDGNETCVIIVRYCATNSFSVTKKFCGKGHFSGTLDDCIFIVLQYAVSHAYKFLY
jgi:hypothetical protein